MTNRPWPVLLSLALLVLIHAISLPRTLKSHQQKVVHNNNNNSISKNSEEEVAE